MNRYSLSELRYPTPTKSLWKAESWCLKPKWCVYPHSVITPDVPIISMQVIKYNTNIYSSSSPLQVMDIAKLMKAYISMIVKKRYSNCQSVSSHGSHCSTW